MGPQEEERAKPDEVEITKATPDQLKIPGWTEVTETNGETYFYQHNMDGTDEVPAFRAGVWAKGGYKLCTLCTRVIAGGEDCLCGIASGRRRLASRRRRVENRPIHRLLREIE